MADLEGLTVGLASDSDLALLNVALDFVDLGPDGDDRGHRRGGTGGVDVAGER